MINAFKRSSKCESANCVEVALTDANWVLVRGTTDKYSLLVFTAEEWQSFIDGVKLGEFDLESMKS